MDLQPEVLASIIKVSGKWALAMSNTPQKQSNISTSQHELEEYYDTAFRFLSGHMDHYLKYSQK